MTHGRCRRCRYGALNRQIDYSRSGHNGKIYWFETIVCEKCGREKPDSTVLRECSIDAIPPRLEVDFTRVVHECNYDDVDHISYEPMYDEEGYCTQLIEVEHLRCSICHRKSDYRIERELPQSDPKVLEYTANEKQRRHSSHN